MKKLLLILLSALSLTVMAQKPNWVDDASRTTNYPKSSYFTGIAYGEIRSGEAAGTAMERVKTAARVEALSTIRIHVQNETKSDTHSESIESIDEWSESIRETFDSKTKTKVDLDIPGLQVEAWKNPNSNEVVGFAYIKKSTLSRQMVKQITAGLTRIETILDNADQQIAQGQKMEARNAINNAIPLFQQVEQAQHILIVADPASDAESLQLAETKQLAQRFIRMSASLKNGINIYLDCKADLFGSSYYALKGEIQGALSPIGCTFVRSAAEADWIITIFAKAREYNKSDLGGESSYFAYVDANIAIDKNATGQRIYEDAISQKGGHTHNFEQAARDAYKQISPKISKIIKEQIQQ